MTRALVAIAIAVAAPARADDARRVPTEARELVERGRALHAAGEYARAIVAFRRAYDLAPTAGLLFNLAQSYRLAGECDDAATMYRRFLASSPRADQRAVAERHLATVERCGRPRVAASAVAPDLQPQPPSPSDSPPPRDDHPGARDKRTGIYLGIAGGAALVAAAYFAIDAADASNEVTALYKHGGGDVAATDARGQRSAVLARVLGTGGAVALAAGGVFFAVGWRLDRDAAAERRLALVPTMRGAEVRLTWGF